MNESNWTVNIAGVPTKALAFAESYNDNDYIIIAKGDPAIMMVYPSKQYKNIITMGTHPLFAIKTRSVNTLVCKFAEYVAPLQMSSLSPIKSVYTRNDIFTRYYTEDGLIDRRIFSGTLEDLQDLMERNSWYLPAKDGGYKEVEYIAETETCDVVAVLYRKDFLGYPVIATPATVTTDGIIYENYGTPAGGKDIEGAITRFNHNIFGSQQYGCKYGQIVRMIDKEGDTSEIFTFSDTNSMIPF